MSDYTRYLLNSAGIKATEQDIEIIDRSGHPFALVQLLAHYQFKAARAESAMDEMMRDIAGKQEKPFKFRKKVRR